MQKLKLKQNAIDLYNWVIDENLKDFFIECHWKEVWNHTNGYFDINKFRVSQYEKTQRFELPRDLFDIEETVDEITSEELPNLVINSDQSQNQKFKIFESIKEIIWYLLSAILLVSLWFYAYTNRQKELKQEEIKQELQIQIEKQKLDIEKTQVLPIKDKLDIISETIESIEKNIDEELRNQENLRKNIKDLNKKIDSSILNVKSLKEKQNQLFLQKINITNLK